MLECCPSWPRWQTNVEGSIAASIVDKGGICMKHWPRGQLRVGREALGRRVVGVEQGLADGSGDSLECLRNETQNFPHSTSSLSYR